MGDRITGQALKCVSAQDLRAVRGALHLDDGAPVALAMAFDPAAVSDRALHAHALDLVTGLLCVRGWTPGPHDVRIHRARDWAGRWWEDTPGPGAFVVETRLEPGARCEVDDLGLVNDLAALAWCMELDVCEGERPMPALMVATLPEGPSLASVHHDAWGEALRASTGAVAGDARRGPQGAERRSHRYVRMHLEGTTVEPWSLPGRSCVFDAAMPHPGCRRTFIALNDTAEAPDSHTTLGLLRLMLASGADD